MPRGRHIHAPDPREAGARSDAVDDRHQPRFHALPGDFDDARLVTVNGSAADVEKILADHGHGSADYVLRAFPSRRFRRALARTSPKRPSNVIRPGGAFLVYQFSPKVRDFIQPHFAPIKRGFEWINVPPATLFWAYKGEPKA